MKAILTCIFLVLFSGCGWSRSQTRIVAGPNGVRVRESSNCVGMDCGARSGMGYAPYGAAALYGWRSPSEQRFGMIREYRSRNVWTRSGGESARGPASSEREPVGELSEVQALTSYVRHMARAMCRNGVMEGDPCIPEEEPGQASEPGEGAGSAPDAEEEEAQTNSENEGEGQ